MVYLLALTAALCNALTSVLQRLGVEDAPADHSMRLSLITHALKKKVWLAGFVLMVCSFGAQAAALHIGRLSEVQPILTSELLFLVVILAMWFRFDIGWREFIGASFIAIGLSGFLVFAAPGGGHLHPSTDEWVEVGASCAGVSALFVVLAQRGPRWWRAAAFGSASAIAFAFTASCTKLVADAISVDPISIFWHWQTYALAAVGSSAVFLTQNAFHAGPIAASQSTLVLVDPLASVLIGITLFGDNLRTQGAWGPLEAFSFLMMFIGAVVISSSPLIARGTGDIHDSVERLANRSRRVRFTPTTR